MLIDINMNTPLTCKETCHACGNMCVDLPSGGRSVSILENGQLLFKKLPIKECKVKQYQAEHVPVPAKIIIDLEEGKSD